MANMSLTTKKIRYDRLKVLIIEDDMFNRKTVNMILSQIGFKQIQEAEDGGSGLEMNFNFLPDLIICDIEMEPIDGLVFLKMLRDSGDIKNCDVPVIFLTGHAESKYVTSARDLGVDAFIVKPPSINSLKSKIDIVLRRAEEKSSENT